MMTLRKFHALRLLAGWAVLAAGIPNAMATPVEPGVSHELAIARARSISELHYQLSFAIKEHASAIAGTETVTFESKAAGELPIDYRDGAIQSATVNGHAIATDEVNGHLLLPVVVGHNAARIVFVSNAAAAGKAITRYEDKDDGSEYFYTL